MRIAIALFLSLCGACGTTTFGSGSAGGHAPPLPPGVTVAKWDHFCGVVEGGVGELTRFLDEASNNGWELVGWSGSGLACFKRPRTTEPRPEGAPAAGTATPPAAAPGR